MVQPTEEPGDPLSRFSLSVFRMNGLLMRNGDRVTRPVGQSSARWQVLGRAGYVPQTVAQMARDMGHARQSVQRIADALDEEGLVAFIENPADRRAKLVDLTPAGAEALSAIYASYEAWSRHIMTKLTPAQLTAAADALVRIADIVEADLSDGGAG